MSNCREAVSMLRKQVRKVLIDKPRNKRRINLNERMQSNNINQRKVPLPDRRKHQWLVVKMKWIFSTRLDYSMVKEVKESNKRRVDEKVKSMIRIDGLKKISTTHSTQTFYQAYYFPPLSLAGARYELSLFHHVIQQQLSISIHNATNQQQQCRRQPRW